MFVTVVDGGNGRDVEGASVMSVSTKGAKVGLSEQTDAREPAEYEPPALVELGSLFELTLADCHHGPHDPNFAAQVFCTSV
jgi:hypothetical protein